MILNTLNKNGAIRKLTGIILPIVLILNLHSSETVSQREKNNLSDPVITSLVTSDFTGLTVRVNNTEKTPAPEYVSGIEKYLREKTRITEISQLSKNDFEHLISFKTFLTAYLYTDP